MSGTGNDFIIIDHRQPLIADADIVAFVKAVCRRNFSVGADGVILIETSEVADFRWRFYNADGSTAEMCGNGARCAARFAKEKGIAPAVMRFETEAGIIEAQVGETSVRVGLTPPFDCKLQEEVELGDTIQECSFINTGVPHALFFYEDNTAVPVVDWGRTMRFHERFQPAGTNVNFVSVTGEKSLSVRTYERGVEGETLACGTGATAAAIVAVMLDRVRPPVTVVTSGGQQLIIHFKLMDGQKIEGLFLEGPAHLVYEGMLQPDAFQSN